MDPQAIYIAMALAEQFPLLSAYRARLLRRALQPAEPHKEVVNAG